MGLHCNPLFNKLSVGGAMINVYNKKWFKDLQSLKLFFILVAEEKSARDLCLVPFS